MPLVKPKVEIFFDLDGTGADVFTLDDPNKGVLDGSTFALGGNVLIDGGEPVDVSSRVFGLSTQRGRSSELTEIPPGRLTVMLRNFDAAFTPANPASPFFGKVVPGKRVRVSIGPTIFDGVIEDWNLVYGSRGEASASLTAVDSLGRLGRTTLEWHVGEDGVLAGERINSILDRDEVGFGANRDIDRGVSELRDDFVSPNTNALTYLNLVARSDQGRLFASRSNLLTFRDRHSTINAEPLVWFGRPPGTPVTAQDTTPLLDEEGFPILDEFGRRGLVFRTATPDYGSERLYNYVTANCVGGEPQVASDPDSIRSYGQRSMNLDDLILKACAEARNLAEYNVRQYAQPRERISTLQVPSAALSEAQAARVSALDIGDVVAVSWTPRGSPVAYSQTLVIEGIDHTVTVSGEHIVDLSMFALDQRSFFVLDDSGLGVLDSNALAF